MRPDLTTHIFADYARDHVAHVAAGGHCHFFGIAFHLAP